MMPNPLARRMPQKIVYLPKFRTVILWLQLLYLNFSQLRSTGTVLVHREMEKLPFRLSYS